MHEKFNKKKCFAGPLNGLKKDSIQGIIEGKKIAISISRHYIICNHMVLCASKSNSLKLELALNIHSEDDWSIICDT